MSKKNVAPQNSTLHEVVKVKKLRFKDIEDKGKAFRYSRDAVERKANFEEFKTVYADSLSKNPDKNTKSKECPLHKTKSGSLFRFPKITNKPNYVETINIELPLHYGAESAIQLVENKIKPKRSVPRVNREVATQNIISKLKKIEEVDERDESITDITKKQIEEIRKQMKARREAMWMNLPRVAQPKTRKKQTKDKIMWSLSSINEKLEKLQKKYLDQPRVQYKSVSDCFTQSGHVEVIYENEKYPEEAKVSDLVTCDIKAAADNSLEELKMQGNMNELNKIFPEFPKIEDTLREIEAHLDNIVNLEVNSGNLKEASSDVVSEQTEVQLDNQWDGANLAAILESLEKQYSPLYQTNKILKDLDHARDAKLRTIRQQIEVVEEFCDRMSEIANDESDDSESVSSAVSNAEKRSKVKGEYKCYLGRQEDGKDKALSKTTEVAEFMEGPELQTSIKKSSYLSKEFGHFDSNARSPMVKIFSDNEQRILWRKKMRSLDKTDFTSAESVTKLIDNLKFTLENSLYEAVS